MKLDKLFLLRQRLSLLELVRFYKPKRLNGIYADLSSVLVTVLLLTACGNNAEVEGFFPSKEYLKVTSQVVMSGDGVTSATLQISANCGWNITGVPQWMTVSTVSGKGKADVEIKCTQNPSALEERTIMLTITSENGTIQQTSLIKQGVGSEYIMTNTEELTFGRDGDTKTLSIQSNVSWTISGIEKWFTLSNTEGIGNADISITATKNELEDGRTAVITIQSGSLSEKVILRQEGHVTTFTVSPSEIQVQSTASTYHLTIEGDAAWTATINADWCSLNKISGEGSEQLTLNVEKNVSDRERQATITFTTNRSTLTCTVRQTGGNAPVVSNITVSEIQKHEVTVSASYTSNYEVTECGFCYSLTNSVPTTEDSVAKATTGTGDFSQTITGLQSGKTYYVRAYAKSAVGLSYGNVKEITTKGGVPGNNDNVTPSV